DGRALGVWLAAGSAAHLAARIGGPEWFRSMTFLGRMLAAQLETLAKAHTHSIEAEKSPAVAPSPLSAAHNAPGTPSEPLAREVARALRAQTPLALICVDLACK